MIWVARGIQATGEGADGGLHLLASDHKVRLLPGYSAIIGGVTLGQECLLGMGAVVRHDIPKHAVMVGNPARFLRPMPACPLPRTLINSFVPQDASCSSST